MAAERTSRRLLITAGPTQEPIDAVRFIGNRSSGRMGIAIAAAAIERGIETTLLLGPTPLTPPEPAANRPPLTVERFRTTSELRACLARRWPDHDVLIMAAAVADFRPAVSSRAPGNEKLPRADGNRTLELEPTEDLVAELATQARSDQFIVGFALEPAATLAASARKKLIKKRVDAIVANPLETMDATHVSASLHLASGAVRTPEPGITKAKFARWLLDEIDAMCAAR